MTTPSQPFDRDIGPLAETDVIGLDAPVQAFHAS